MNLYRSALPGGLQLGSFHSSSVQWTLETDETDELDETDGTVSPSVGGFTQLTRL